MKKKSIFIVSLVAISLASLVWYGCTKDSDEDLLGTIYGTVTDYATGQAIGNVNVTLRPSGETTLTGNDGTFEFNDLKANKYSLSFSKAEYADLDDDYIIELEAGKKVKRDVQMRKQIASLQIVDMNGNPLDTLDFGDGESVTVKTFNIFNNGTEKLSCSANYECEWITNVSGLENDIPAGQTVPVTVRIDRVALADGVNTTFLYIISGNGSNEVVVKATFKGTVAITTAQPTNVTATSATVGGNITKIPLAREIFDLATAFETIYYWPSFDACLVEILRVLKPGGTLVIGNEMNGESESDREMEHAVGAMRIYTGDELRMFLKDAGYTHIRVRHDDQRRFLCVAAQKPKA